MGGVGYWSSRQRGHTLWYSLHSIQALPQTKLHRYVPIQILNAGNFNYQLLIFFLAENFEIEFGRAPEDECGTASCFCDIQTPLYPWRQEILEETRTISVRIGQSGGKRGYAGITGEPAYVRSI